MAMTTDSHPLPMEHNPLASMPHDTHGGISNPVLGMLLFITSEVMFFGGLFAAYFSIRANAARDASDPKAAGVCSGPVISSRGWKLAGNRPLIRWNSD